MKGCIFVLGMSMSSNLRVCRKCKKEKVAEKDFYVCKGKMRGECKVCTIKANVKYQQKNKSWRNRFVDEDSGRSYMSEYYANNKEKFAEYGRKFRERNPEYHKLYARKRKNEKPD